MLLCYCCNIVCIHYTLSPFWLFLLRQFTIQLFFWFMRLEEHLRWRSLVPSTKESLKSITSTPIAFNWSPSPSLYLLKVNWKIVVVFECAFTSPQAYLINQQVVDCCVLGWLLIEFRNLPLKILWQWRGGYFRSQSTVSRFSLAMKHKALWDQYDMDSCECHMRGWAFTRSEHNDRYCPTATFLILKTDKRICFISFLVVNIDPNHYRSFGIHWVQSH